MNGTIYLLDNRTVVVGTPDWTLMQCRALTQHLTAAMPDYRWLVMPFSFAAFDSRGAPDLADRAAALATDLMRLGETDGG